MGNIQKIMPWRLPAFMHTFDCVVYVTSQWVGCNILAPSSGDGQSCLFTTPYPTSVKQIPAKAELMCSIYIVFDLSLLPLSTLKLKVLHSWGKKMEEKWATSENTPCVIMIQCLLSTNYIIGFVLNAFLNHFILSSHDSMRQILFLSSLFYR